METIAFTNNSYGIGKTKQKALINLLGELEHRNAQARMIKFSKIKKDDDPFDFVENNYYDSFIKL